MQEWAENKLKQHNKFVDNFNNTRTAGKDLLKQKSKSCGDIARKAKEKWKSSYDKLANERAESNAGLMEHHEQARIRCEERAKQKLKCDNDVFSFREYKYGTWGELQQKRNKEYKQAIDANTQALVFKIGEDCAAKEAKEAANENLKKQ